MEHNTLMAEYGHIQVIFKEVVPKGKLPFTKKHRIEIHNRFYHRGYSFLVHKSTKFKGWVVSEERSGSIASATKVNTTYLENKGSSHKTVESAIKQTKINLDNFLATGKSFDDLVDGFVANILKDKDTYIELIKKNLL